MFLTAALSASHKRGAEEGWWTAMSTARRPSAQHRRGPSARGAGMRNARVSLLACGFVYALIAGPPEARAAADLGTRCQARKLALAGTYANRALQCAAAAARRGTTVDADRSARPRDRLTTHFASAEARGMCVRSSTTSSRASAAACAQA